jgi:hypothetical protein
MLLGNGSEEDFLLELSDCKVTTNFYTYYLLIHDLVWLCVGALMHLVPSSQTR